MLGGMLENGDGQVGSLRVVFALCVLIIFAVWAWLSIKGGALISFDAMDLALVGSLFGAKDIEKWIENRKAPTALDPPSRPAQ